MSTNVQLLFGKPRREIASYIENLYINCESASIVVGFMTVEGVKSVSKSIEEFPSKLQKIVVGAASFQAFDAFDRLLHLGVSPQNLRVHLGHSRKATATAKYPFYRYRPMIHSKMYLFSMPGGNATVIVGSQNMTGFALNGLNGEAGVLVSGASTDQIFLDAEKHVAEAFGEAVIYEPSLREAYAWWAEQFMLGLAAKFDDAPRDSRFARTVVIIAEKRKQGPKAGDVIYFELPKALGRVNLINAEVHIYLFDTLPPSPGMAMAQLSLATSSIWCRAIGLEDDRGGRELRADWFIDDHLHPIIQIAPKPFRPSPTRDMEQIRVEAYQEVKGQFEYLFSSEKGAFEPILDRESTIELSSTRKEATEALGLIPPEHLPWFRVVGLRRQETGQPSEYKQALQAFSPEAGSYILMSLRRREG